MKRRGTLPISKRHSNNVAFAVRVEQEKEAKDTNSNLGSALAGMFKEHRKRAVLLQLFVFYF